VFLRRALVDVGGFVAAFAASTLFAAGRLAAGCFAAGCFAAGCFAAGFFFATVFAAVRFLEAISSSPGYRQSES
jgi:hypothetical protein